jgi:hypothetical protein
VSFHGLPRRVLLAGALALASAAGCATTQWADEPGKPVPVGLAENVEIGDQFMNALTSARGAQGLPPPVIAPRYQSELRPYAEDLQAGKTSAPGALKAIKAWGRRAYHGEVETWVVDCGPGRPMEMPSRLLKLPEAIVAYAGARFQPQSSPSAQCAVLVVGLVDTTHVPSVN